MIFKALAHILPSSYPSCHTGLCVEQKINVEMVAGTRFSVFKAEIQIPDNPGLWGMCSQVQCPSHYKMTLSVKTVCPMYRWNWKSLVKIIDIKKRNLLLNQEIMSDYRSKFCSTNDNEGLKIYVGGKNEFVIHIFYLWSKYFLENVNKRKVWS